MRFINTMYYRNCGLKIIYVNLILSDDENLNLVFVIIKFKFVIKHEILLTNKICMQLENGVKAIVLQRTKILKI